MNIYQVLLCLVGLGIITLIITNRKKQKNNFWDTVDVVEILIKEGKLTKVAYLNILNAFREFNSISYKDERKHRELLTLFQVKYILFFPVFGNQEIEDYFDSIYRRGQDIQYIKRGMSLSDKIKIIPDNSEGYYNYKIEV
jgi:hypothetical protein